MVPAAFRLLDADVTTARVVFEALSCERSTVEDLVVPGAAFLYASVVVQPLNESWAEGKQSRFTLGVLVADDELAQRLQAMGLAAGGATLNIEPVGPFETWTFDAGDARAQLAVGEPTGDGAVGDTPIQFYWVEEGDAYRRVRVEKAYQYDSMVYHAGTLHLEGSWALGGSLPTCCPPWLGQRYGERNDLWTLDALFAA